MSSIAKGAMTFVFGQTVHTGEPEGDFRKFLGPTCLVLVLHRGLGVGVRILLRGCPTPISPLVPAPTFLVQRLLANGI